MLHTIVIKVGQDRPENIIKNLVETFKAVFPDEIIDIREALVIETDIKLAAEIFQKIAESSVNISPNWKAKKFTCVECGAPVFKAGGRCKKHLMQMIAKEREAKLSTGEQNDLEMAEFLGAVESE